MANKKISDLTALSGASNAADLVEIETSGGLSRKMTIAQLLLAMHPVGESYTQNYGDPLPSDLYGGTWTIRFNNNATSEMTESSGGATWGALAFDGVIRDSQTQGMAHKHNFSNGVPTLLGGGPYGVGDNGNLNTTLLTSDCVYKNDYGTPRLGLETRSRVRIVREFTRTA
jgi:hypothetical protein